MIDRLKKNVPDPSSGVLVFCISLLVFVSIMVLGVQTDIQTHIIRNSYPNANPGLMPNFLFYWFVWLLSFLLRSRLLVGGVVAIVLALAVLWKYVVSSKIIYRELEKEGQSFSVWTRIETVGLIFLFSLPVGFDIKHYYLGQFPANIWHNSTTILVMPFVVLAFDSCCQYFIDPDRKVFLRLMLWSALIYIIKPSILPVFILIFPAFTLFKQGGTKGFLWTLLYSFTFGLLLIFPMVFVANGNIDRVAEGGLEIALFKVWSLYSDNYAGSLIASLLFPLGCVVLYMKEAIKDIRMWFGWSCWGLSFIMFTLINETGHFIRAGNFGWQVIMASFLLFLTSLNFTNARMQDSKKHGWKVIVLRSLFGLHLISGLFYLVKLILVGYQ